MSRPDRCTDCGTSLYRDFIEIFEIDDELLCGSCYDIRQRDARDQERDHRLDDPRHGQAKDINRGR